MTLKNQLIPKYVGYGEERSTARFEANGGGLELAAWSSPAKWTMKA